MGQTLGLKTMSTLEVRRLTKRYRRVAVVNDVNFTVKSGEITGYLGPNGSGKSTTVKMLTGLVEPSQGEILLDGIDIRRNLIAFKRILGYVPEEAHVYPSLTGMEYLQLMGRLRELPERVVNEKATDLLKLFSLYLHRHAPLASYSKGMKQRVLISAALLHDPDVLIFDEPLSGLDVSSALLFKHLIAELASRGKIILYISHVLEVVERVCSKIVVIYRGQIKAEDSVVHLRDLMQLPSLEEIFTQLVQQEDMESVARDIAEAISRGAA
ncbi:MAG TPA: ABC transporter ATP-binding protein [Terriglobia bacterium]|nr:ABC transporter ATP-binding protein [Terriglobia bacterium]